MAEITETTQQVIIDYISVANVCTCTYINPRYIPLFLMAKYVTTPTRHPRHPEFQTTTRPSLFKPWGRITSLRMMRIQGHYGGNYTSFNPSQTASGRYGRSLPTFHWDVWVMHRACHHFQVGHSHAQNSSAVGSPLNLPGILPRLRRNHFNWLNVSVLPFTKMMVDSQCLVVTYNIYIYTYSYLVVTRKKGVYIYEYIRRHSYRYRCRYRFRYRY